MQLRLEEQQNPVGDEVSALIAVVRPILSGILFSLKQDVVAEVGGHEQIKLFMLPRLRKPGDGDCGICFEYAVHDAMNRREPMVMERVSDALKKHCKVKGKDAASILFGAEKSGALQLIDTAKEWLTNESDLLVGSAGRPVKLKKHIASVAAAFRRPTARDKLPQSISGLWKADLFLGHTDTDYWVGTSVKVNKDHLEGARGLRIGIVPSKEGRGDLPYKDETRNLVVCPLAHDGSFMEVFYEGWDVVMQFLHADAKLPKEVALPRPAKRQVARFLEERRAFPVVEVLEALEPLAQPELLKTIVRPAGLAAPKPTASTTSSILAPRPNQLKK
ncbi:hypothetical protein HI113_38595 [Corallococcus exiguus]|uniref:hypothetical protein n=1 Tax=Corallococcus exiguus TaxID=83462 RepID=UPI001473E3C1|nr:hypothetical protein [Corallococcus exiguus]NNB99806.1 hypothetical protein [Corallococcus exiguus]